MWLATKLGFYSVVEKAPDEFHIRARVAADLETLRAAYRAHWVCDLPEVEKWPGADYRFRLIVDRDRAHAALYVLISSIDYSNFKSEIAATPDQRGKLSAYHKIWATMAALTKE